MELSQLRQFAAIAATENLSQAARILYVSQPALTHSLKKLEQELNVELFTRTSNSISLNEEGKKALDFTRIILSAADEMESYFQGIDRETAETLTLFSAVPSVARYILPRFAAARPEKELITRILQPSETKRALLDGDCDGAFVINPVNMETMGNMPICRDGWLASVPQSHPLYDCDRIPLSELKGSQAVFLMDRYAHSRELLAKLKRVGIRVQTVDDHQIYRSILKTSEKIGFFSSLGLSYYEELSRRRYVPLTDKSMQTTVYLAYLRENGNKLMSFFTWFKENYKELV